VHKERQRSTALRITILADDSYYSTSPHGDRSDKFSDFGVALQDAHKTGLGSSAALVTALTAALLVFLDPIDLFTNLSDPATQKRIHNLAQASHCAAQGKVGSGFDVAAAVYGSCLYRRFSPDILSTLGDSQSPGFGDRLHRCVEDLNLEQPWNVEVSSKAVEIPNSLLLLMCDVDCGSETPGMVKKVLAWRKEKPEEALLLWNALQQGTEDLCRSLTRLAKKGDSLSVNEQINLGDIIQTIRSMVRDMSANSQVPIEPPVITELLDYCTGLPGVVGGVAPGAGGYDAVALLVRNDAEVVQDLEERLQCWKTSSEGVEGAKVGKVSLLKVEQEYNGVRVEDVMKYESWVR
jgi:phosphomevalonate kinase